MPEATINLLAVLVAAIAGHLLGGIWFSSKVFGKTWMESSNCDPAEMDKHKSMAKVMTVSFLGTLVMTYVFAHFADYIGVNTLGEGLALAFWTWLGFFATTSLGSVLWDKKRPMFWVVMNGYYLVQLVIMGVILSLWR